MFCEVLSSGSVNERLCCTFSPLTLPHLRTVWVTGRISFISVGGELCKEESWCRDDRPASSWKKTTLDISGLPAIGSGHKQKRSTKKYRSVTIYDGINCRAKKYLFIFMNQHNYSTFFIFLCKYGNICSLKIWQNGKYIQKFYNYAILKNIYLGKWYFSWNTQWSETGCLIKLWIKHF